MKNMSKLHTVHIPVMGTGFSIDTPVKVARYGISSVISLVDDTLIEQMRKFYCEKAGEAYTPITKYDHDFRARRITEYLNLLDRIIKKQFAELKASAFETGTEITKYFELLPDSSPVKKTYLKMLATVDANLKQKMQAELRESIRPGFINVNIMTKLDRTNYDLKGAELTSEFSDALAALRGYAQSTLHSAIVFSAGINRRLYSYVENFKDFSADVTGFIQKKIVIKVSDYRSAIIQGKFLAKKGIWVSEYRVESGLNCGGHCFPSAGELMGPILEEFKVKKAEFIDAVHQMYNEALKLKNKMTFNEPHAVYVTAQGGIGTYNEDKFLREYYQLDGTGWGTPFLLVPEATNVDDETLRKLSMATEKDVYVSDVSPLGVPFNNLRSSLSDTAKDERAASGKPGSPCPKGHLVSNTEFTAKAICTASRQYQKLKIDQIHSLNIPEQQQAFQITNVTKKSCLCNDLGDGAILKNGIVEVKRQLFPAVCPGPNIAYFSKIVSFKEMIDHIYGRLNVLNPGYRPHMFIKELKINVDFLLQEIQKALPVLTPKQIEYFEEYRTNLLKGIEYYFDLYPKMVEETAEIREKAIEELKFFKAKLDNLSNEFGQVYSHPIPLGISS